MPGGFSSMPRRFDGMIVPKPALNCVERESSCLCSAYCAGAELGS